MKQKDPMLMEKPMRGAKGRFLPVALLWAYVFLISTEAILSEERPALTAEQKAKLQQRDEQSQQAEQLRGDGKYREALAAAKQALELTREIRGQQHAEEAKALPRLAALQELTGDLAEAVKNRKAVLVLQQRLAGQKHWRTADTKHALAFADRLMGAPGNLEAPGTEPAQRTIPSLPQTEGRRSGIALSS
jgi:hypothetical protein